MLTIKNVSVKNKLFVKTSLHITHRYPVDVRCRLRYIHSSSKHILKLERRGNQLIKKANEKFLRLLYLNGSFKVWNQKTCCVKKRSGTKSEGFLVAIRICVSNLRKKNFLFKKSFGFFNTAFFAAKSLRANLTNIHNNYNCST
jgi:hypothetical protein